MFIICVILLAIVISAVSARPGKIIVCNSISCKWNKLCRCTRNKIAVYDNTVKGLCLNHTQDMTERILKPMQEKRIIEYGISDSDFGRGMTEKIMKLHEENLLKDPDTFAMWMDKAFRKRHGKQKQ